MRWERELGDALRELARSADVVPENPETERRLLEAFDGRRGAEGKHGGLPHEDLRSRRRGGLPRLGLQPSWYLAAAAGLTLVVAGWWGALQLRQTARTAPSSEPAAAVAASVPTAPQNVLPQPNEAPPATVAAAAPQTLRSEAPLRPVRRPIPTAALAADVADDADEFVTLPAAQQLPRFESGMVVRVELPASSLPAYGFPIMPDGARTPITADVLVGQDGQPRAIRLVSMQSATRRYR